MTSDFEKRGFSFGEVNQVLRHLYKVHDEKRDTFTARLQQLQKAGIPAGTNVGRGMRVRYLNWQVCDLVLALDLLGLGLTPATLVNNPEASVYAQMGYGLQVQSSLSDGRPDLFYLIRPNALAYLSSPSEDTTAPNPLNNFQMGRVADSALKSLSVGPAIVVNMTVRLRAVLASVKAVLPDMINHMEFHPTRSGQKED